jgi:hypothetical protein
MNKMPWFHPQGKCEGPYGAAAPVRKIKPHCEEEFKSLFVKSEVWNR